ncbi:MAG: hypothetical protein NVS1B11_36240 [Terriglobales bacterium]
MDLRDGHFELNGVAFHAHPDSIPLPAGGQYSLVYTRDHTHEIVAGKEVSHAVAYRFGWEYRMNDRVWKQTVIL